MGKKTKEKGNQEAFSPFKKIDALADLPSNLLKTRRIGERIGQNWALQRLPLAEHVVETA